MKVIKLALIAVTFLSFLQPVFACSWDYPIWQVRDKNADPLYRFVKGEKAGYIDKTGKIVVQPTLDVWGNYGRGFHDGLLMTGLSEGTYIDKTGRIAFDKKFYRNWHFSDGLAAAVEDDGNKWGFIDRTGEFVISPRFDIYPHGNISSFSEGRAMVQTGRQVGYIDTAGEFVIPQKFIHGEDFHEGMARVISGGACDYYDYENPCGETRRLGVLIEGQKAGACRFSFIDRFGRLVSEETFENAKDFSEGLAPVLIGNKWGYIDKAGEMVIAPKYKNAYPFSDGLARVTEGELWGFIDKKGKLVIPFQFEIAEDFADRLVPVGKRGRENQTDSYYFIGKDGKRAFPGDFQIASFFFKGLAHVKLHYPKRGKHESYKYGKYAYIDTSGKKIFAYDRYDEDEED